MDSAPRTAKRPKPAYVDWRRAVADSHLPAPQKHVALTLSLYFNEHGGNAYPGPARLASDTGFSTSTVKRALRALEDAGWLLISTPGGSSDLGRRANVYQLTYPEQTEPGADETGFYDDVNRVQSEREPGAEEPPISIENSEKKTPDVLKSEPKTMSPWKAMGMTRYEWNEAGCPTIGAVRNTG